MSSELLPAGAPAVITYDAAAPRSAAEFVDDLLDRLDRVARELYPAWLPSAVRINDPAGAAAVAVRSIALRDLRGRGHFGPFVADLAERSLRGEPARRRFAPETRVAELAKVIARSFGRHRVAILVGLPAQLTAGNERALVSAGRWLADSGRLGIWFAGSALDSIDDVARVRWHPPVPDSAAAGAPHADELSAGELCADELAGELCADELAACEETAVEPVRYPAIAGRPHPGSPAEQALEAALAGVDWAGGREWNQPYQAHPLTNPIRVDLLWRAERCVVEIDGPEHRYPAQFARDRQRDVHLQLAGYAVLRFTNAQVVRHRDLVLSQLRQFLHGRRAVHRKGFS